jgi:hypothetical protein
MPVFGHTFETPVVFACDGSVHYAALVAKRRAGRRHGIHVVEDDGYSPWTLTHPYPRKEISGSTESMTEGQNWNTATLLPLARMLL